MHRLPVILCLVALLGSTVSAVLFFQIGNSKRILEMRFADAATRATKLDTDLAVANEQNGSLKAKLGALEVRAGGLDAELGATKAKLTAADARATQLTVDLSQTRDVLALYESTARALADDVTALRKDLEESRASNAAPEAVAAYRSTILELEGQLATARNAPSAPATASGSTAVFASRAGRASVLTVGPNNAFVVLNFGEARGAQLGHRLSVSQGTNVVATVLISDVRANFSVAQVMPDTLRGVLQKGDSAVLIRTP
ncbi:MAG: hypothetical protein ABIQ12_14255 [Opitutaceae bacterium]